MTTEHMYKHSPWGAVQYQSSVIPGVVSVGTASHGGLKLSKERQAAMPDYMRCEGGWYEEDCDWAKVYAVFAVEIRRYYEAHPEDANAVHELRNLERVPDSLKNWHPEIYERFFGEQIPAGESYVREHQVDFKVG